MGRKSRKKKFEIPKARSRFNSKIVISTFVAVFLAGLVGILATASYTRLGTPPIPKPVVRIADIAIASFPALPKTSNQVLAKALFETSRIGSGEHKFNLQLVQNIEEGKDDTIFTLEITGPFRKKDNQVDLAGTVSFSLPNDEGDSKVEFVEKDDFFYFRLESMPDLLGLYFSKLQGSWYKLDVTKVLSDAKASTRSDAEIEKTISEKLQTVLDVIESENLILDAKVLPDEEIDRQISYHYRLDLNEEQTKEVVDALSGGSEELPDIKRISLDLWINKASFVINEMAIGGVIASDPQKPTENVVLNLPDVNFELVYKLKRPNDDVVINTPESSKDLNSLFDLYVLVQDDDKKDPASAILGAVSNLGEFGANFLTIERLIHVLYLAPQSF